jgi:hypothetical protein
VSLENRSEIIIRKRFPCSVFGSSSSTMGEVTAVRVNKTYNLERVKTQDMRTIY